MRTSVRALGLTTALAAALGCSREESTEGVQPSAAATTLVAAPSAAPPPRVLYLPDGASHDSVASLGTSDIRPVHVPRRCPPDMVDVRGEFCIDRYEASLVDVRSGEPLSPHYHPTRTQTRAAFRRWTRASRDASPEVAVPTPPERQLEHEVEPAVAVRRGALPSGYLSAKVAERACRNAHKRLCTEGEWVTACRGEADRKFPYGDDYVTGRCNVFRETHPATVLHGNASTGHLDPRLNLVRDTSTGVPLLRITGEHAECASKWGGDAVYDMVGNLDEWVDDAGGVFVGGFFSRSTREGCESRISAHTRAYFDYSLGARCCK